MEIKQQIVYMGINYEVLKAEQEFIVHPSAFELLPVSMAALQSSYTCKFHIDHYCMLVDRIEVSDNDTGEVTIFEPEDCRADYNGTVLLGANLVKEYNLKGKEPACFSYQNVLELVFENGMLITTVDQSKAMLRIRKNLELGLRSLNKKRDVRCIRRFMNSRFVGDYKPFLLPSRRLKYLKELKETYTQQYC